MTLIKTAAQSILKVFFNPDAVNRIGNIYNDSTELLSCGSDPGYRKSVRRLQALKDKHCGKRCFIIGNGPSLNKMDLSPLEHEITFGLNRIYLLFDKIGFNTTYFVSVNKHVIEQCATEIERLSCMKFISWNARNHIKFTPDTVILRSRSGPRFCCDVSRQGIWEGATVTYVAMQLAYYMGISEVILIGVDHNFKTEGEPHKLIVSQGEDPNHFDPHYFGKGFKWQLPDLKMSEQAYELARRAFENDGRRIVDATVGGKLQVFPKVEYKKIISK